MLDYYLINLSVFVFVFVFVSGYDKKSLFVFVFVFGGYFGIGATLGGVKEHGWRSDQNKTTGGVGVLWITTIC